MQIYRDHIKLFSPNAWRFTIARFIFAIGIAITRVFLNLYLLGIGFDQVFLGVISSITLLGGAIFTIPAMLLLDHIGRRRTMIFGAFISIMSWFASIILHTRETLLLFQFLAGLGDVMYGLSVVPMLAEISGKSERTTLFSINEGMTLVGVFIGSVISGPLALALANTLTLTAESATAYQAIIIASILIRFVGLFPLYLIDHNVDAVISHSTNSPESSGHKPSRLRTIRYLDPRVLLRLHSPIFRLLIPWAMVYFAGSLIFPFLNVFIKSRFSVSDTVLGATLGFINLSDGLATILGPAVVRFLGRRGVVMLGTFISAICMAIIGFNENFAVVAVVVILRAGVFNMILPIYRAFTIDYTPRNEYVIVSFILSAATNVGQAFAPPLSGYMQRNMGGWDLPFILAILLYAMAGLAFMWVMGRVQRNQAVSQ
jgi:MFS family permease